ncbi:DUF6716 putative glycosyltransferase [Propionibacteriaceae bacterium Y1700]|uniref:DUF6716 putative glycosyltransferase n=1 Tax=Microlunatus sp. Y1700 TaxID=3418487 RepID=UPI003DA73280
MPRVLAVTDSDSYLKWTAATLAAMPSEWDTELVVIANPVAPSPGQRTAALGGTTAVPELRLAAVIDKIVAERPDVLLLGTTGPVLHMITKHTDVRGPDRPVIMTGLPGISIPATERAIGFRRMCDLFVLHSVREVTDFAALAAEDAPQLRFGLATLPFLPPAGDAADRPSTGEVIFAAQAKVPARPDQRRAVLRALAAMGPEWQPVVKVRAVAGEKQTHAEEYAYDELWRELCAEDDSLDPDRITFRGGSMADALAGAAAFVTVSSTAALEAIADRVPALVISEFGVNAEMINIVFNGSGLLGSLDRLTAAEFTHPAPTWLHENYFHEPAINSWLDQLLELLTQRAEGALPSHPYEPMGHPLTRVRHWTRLRFPKTAPVVWDAAVKVGRRVKRLRPRHNGG